MSALLASLASVPPWAFRTLEFRIDVGGVARMRSSAGLAFLDVTTTVLASGVVTVTPSSRNAPLLCRLTRRSSENLTSALVTGVPSENVASASVNVKDLASLVPFQDAARSGTGSVLPGSKVTSVSYIALTSMLLVGVNSWPGSMPLSTNELSMTSVPVGAPLAAFVCCRRSSRTGSSTRSRRSRPRRARR